MAQSPTDLSNLESLSPSCPLDLQMKALKTSARIQGSYTMALRRASRAPESSRSFVQGDPVHLIDWKAYARTDQLILREQRDEASAKVRICLDATSTMHWPSVGFDNGSSKEISSKIEIATRLAFNLAHIHLRLGDSVDLWLLSSESDDKASHKFRPRSPSEVVGVFQILEKAKFSAEAYLSSFHLQPFESGKVDSSYWVGDCLGNGNYHQFFQSGRTPILFHVLSSLEIDTSWLDGGTSYFDETFGKKDYLGSFLNQADNYRKGLEDWRQRLQKKLRQDEGGYFLATDQTSIASYLGFLTNFSKQPSVR